VDALTVANWQRAGGKGGRPTPVPRPDARAEQRRREYVSRLRRMGLIPGGVSRG